MQNQNQNLPEDGRDVVFRLSSGPIFCGLFSAGKFLSVDAKKNIVPFKKEFVVAWVYAEDAFLAWETNQVRRPDSFEGLPGYDAIKQQTEQPERPATGNAPDWERRRYEIARDVLAGKYIHDGGYGIGGADSVQKQAKEAVMYADILIAKLKKTTLCKDG